MFYFINETSDINTYNAFVSKIIGGNKKEDLFNEMKEKLQFPHYFGNNWDALYDCLCDLSWIDKQRIVLIHENLPNIDNSSLKNYLDLLFDVSDVWRLDENKDVKFYFLNKDEAIINKFINQES